MFILLLGSPVLFIYRCVDVKSSSRDNFIAFMVFILTKYVCYFGVSYTADAHQLELLRIRDESANQPIVLMNYVSLANVRCIKNAIVKYNWCHLRNVNIIWKVITIIYQRYVYLRANCPRND